MNVPFHDLRQQHRRLGAGLRHAIDAVVESGHFAGGPFLEAFESEFAAFCGTRHAIGVGSGTEALWLALLASGIGPGDEVITVTMSFFATGEAIHRTGAKPVFVDIDEATYTMNPDAVEAAITAATRAIVPVHLFGQCADMDPIIKIAAKRGLLVIEDAAQAHGARYRGKMAGSLGHAGCFSFYPGKNLGAMGQGGAVVTNDAELSRSIRSLGNHGQIQKSRHARMGWNGRLDSIQAAVLSVKLRDLERGNRLRRSHAASYGETLAGHRGIVLPFARPAGEHVYHIYSIQTDNRAEMIEAIESNGIGYGIHYPTPIHLQPAAEHLGYRRGQFPVSERCADRFLSLPMFPEMERWQIEKVTAVVGRAVPGAAAIR